MKIAGIVGAGRVGLCLAGLMARAKIHVLINDKNPLRKKTALGGDLPFFEPDLQALLKENQSHLKWAGQREDLLLADIIFFCMSAPFHPQKGLNLKEIFALTQWLAEKSKKNQLLVIKSSFPPGTHKQMRKIIRAEQSALSPIVCPEFLRQGQALKDILQPERLVIGASHREEAKSLEAFYKSFCRPKRVFHTDPETAELSKLASNAFLALKISFANHIAALSEPIGAKPQEISQILGADPRIGSEFLTPGLGYGGACLPKDLKLTLLEAQKRGQNIKLLKAVEELNKKLPEAFCHKIKRRFKGNLQGVPLAFWGLSFKKNTEDLKNSPAFELICRLLKEGALIRLYDPLFTGKKSGVPLLLKAKKAQDLKQTACLKPFNATNSKTDSLLKAAKKAPLDFLKQKIKEGALAPSSSAASSLIGQKGLIIGSNWDEFKIPLPEIKKRLTQAFIADGRGLFSPEDLKAQGFAFCQQGLFFQHSAGAI